MTIGLWFRLLSMFWIIGRCRCGVRCFLVLGIICFWIRVVVISVVARHFTRLKVLGVFVLFGICLVTSDRGVMSVGIATGGVRITRVVGDGIGRGRLVLRPHRVEAVSGLRVAR
jgi:hypothetical protein